MEGADPGATDDVTVTLLEMEPGNTVGAVCVWLKPGAVLIPCLYGSCTRTHVSHHPTTRLSQPPAQVKGKGKEESKEDGEEETEGEVKEKGQGDGAGEKGEDGQKSVDAARADIAGQIRQKGNAWFKKAELDKALVRASMHLCVLQS